MADPAKQDQKPQDPAPEQPAAKPKLVKVWGLGGCTLDGEEYAPEKDGSIEVPARHVALLVQTHGASLTPPKKG